MLHINFEIFSFPGSSHCYRMNFSKEVLEEILYGQKTFLHCFDTGKHHFFCFLGCLQDTPQASKFRKASARVTWKALLSLLSSQGSFRPVPAAQHELKLLKVKENSGNLHYGVFCGQLTIKEGMRFCPYTGNIVCPDKIKSTALQREPLWEVRDYCTLNIVFVP